MDKQRLQQIEEYILGFFQRRQHSRILAKDLFDSTIEYANGDLVRAMEDLEKKHRLLVRYTYEGNDYVSLTPQGASRRISKMNRRSCLIRRRVRPRTFDRICTRVGSLSILVFSAIFADLCALCVNKTVP
jgi:hypothetical protein